VLFSRACSRFDGSVGRSVENVVDCFSGSDRRGEVEERERFLIECNRGLGCALDSRTGSASLQRGDLLGPPHTSEHLGAFPIHQVRSLVGGTRPERKEDTEDAPNMPRLSSSGTMGRRFYKKAHMRPAEDGSGYVVLLDSRELKTPARKPLKVPNPALALAIAAEWEWQVSHLRML
jgi:hypothetical protein